MPEKRVPDRRPPDLDIKTSEKYTRSNCRSHRMSDYSTEYRNKLHDVSSGIPKEDFSNKLQISHNDLSQSSEDIKRAQQIVGPNGHVRIRSADVLIII